jgi:hypothetical protein
MAKVSEYYNLGRTQPSLDFVDVDVAGDVQVFVDPRAIRLLHTEWGEQCRELLTTFFSEVLSAIQADDVRRARQLMSRLREPNETHLGFSVGRSRGHGLGLVASESVADALSASRAARSGLLKDLEDSVLLVPRVGHDIVSDITTNVLRGPLIAYTQAQAAYHDIPTEEVSSGPVWNPIGQWEEGFVRLPTPRGRKLLLVPKSLVRVRMDFNKDEYYGDYLIPLLQAEELERPGSELVQMLRSGPRVTKKEIKEKYGTSKDAVAELTTTHRQALEAYRRQKGQWISPPLNHDQLADLTGTDPPDLHALLAAVRAAPPGPEHAGTYHRAVEALLTALFYPALTDPELENRIHSGRKRIDIRYTNVARRGFFDWLVRHRVPTAHVYVECKNYTGDPGNPELDQLAGRFSPLRGQVGLLVCRTLTDKALFIQRCRDTALDRRGYCLPLDDDDLTQLVLDATAGPVPTRPSAIDFPLLKQRYDALIS